MSIAKRAGELKEGDFIINSQSGKVCKVDEVWDLGHEVIIFTDTGAALNVGAGEICETLDLSTDGIVSFVEDKANYQKHIASLYKVAIFYGGVDFAEINTAIVERWSRSGLLRVKRMAWA